MDQVAFIVAQNLEFDVMRIFDELFDVNRRIAKRFLGLAASGMVTLDKGDIVMRHPHPASAAARDGFDDNRITDTFGDLERFLFVFDEAIGAWRDRNARFFAKFRLMALSSNAFIARELGPIKRMLQFSQTSAKCPFSERKP